MSDEPKAGQKPSRPMQLTLRMLVGALTCFGVGLTAGNNGGALLARPELLWWAAAGAIGVLGAELLDLATRPTTKDDLFRDP